MVGALADWFAVVALFRRPLGLPIPHTAVIARNQARIGRNLATFVRDKFLDVPSLVALIRRHDPAERLAQWLTAPGNAGLLGHQATRLASAALEMVQDAQVERFIHKAARALIGQVDISRALAAVLDTLTHNGRHQALLDDVLGKLIELLQNEQTRAWVAQSIVAWLKKDHPRTEKLLPSDWLGDKGSVLLARALESLMADVAANPQHALRAQFDGALQRLIDRLKSDPSGPARARKCAPGCRPMPRWAAMCSRCGWTCAARCSATWPMPIQRSRGRWAGWGCGWGSRWRAMPRCGSLSMTGWSAGRRGWRRMCRRLLLGTLRTRCGGGMCGR